MIINSGLNFSLMRRSSGQGTTNVVILNNTNCISLALNSTDIRVLKN